MMKPQERVVITKIHDRILWSCNGHKPHSATAQSAALELPVYPCRKYSVMRSLSSPDESLSQHLVRFSPFRFNDPFSGLRARQRNS